MPVPPSSGQRAALDCVWERRVGGANICQTVRKKQDAPDRTKKGPAARESSEPLGTNATDLRGPFPAPGSLVLLLAVGRLLQAEGARDLGGPRDLRRIDCDHAAGARLEPV